VLSRVLRGDTYSAGTTFYEGHLKQLQKFWIMKDISVPGNTEIRGYVMLMLMRTAQKV
jgi:hypothetical protein